MKTPSAVQVWNHACELAIQTHHTLAPCSNAVIREEITRTSIDVAAEIAQGYELKSRHDGHALLSSARGTCAALRTRLYIAGQLNMIEHRQSDRLINETLQISAELEELLEQYDHKYCPWN